MDVGELLADLADLLVWKCAANLRRRKMPPSPRWRLDEMVSKIAGERVWIWRAVDDEGEVMDVTVQKRRYGCVARTLGFCVEQGAGVADAGLSKAGQTRWQLS